MRHVLVTTTPGLLLRVFTASLLINSLVVCSVLLNATTRPTVALIPDAWHSPIHYLELTHRISQGGHSVVTQRLPSCDSKIPKFQSITTDAAFIRSNVLLPQIDNGEEMVLIMHSYGGCPGSMAADGLSVSERRKIGKPGGIIGMIMICGFVIRAGQTLRTMLPGDKFQPWVIQYDDGQLGISNAKEIFYNDVPSVIADLAISELESQSRKSFESMTGYPAWANPVYNGRRSYVKTLLDKALPLGGQDYMIQRSAVDWNVGEFITSHSPFLSQPRQLSEWILAEIARFMGDTAVTATS